MDITAFLIPTALKGLVLAAVAVVACSALRRARGAVLHAVLAALFVALVALPVLQVSGPVWRVPVALLRAHAPDLSTTGAASHDDLSRGVKPEADANGAAPTPAFPPTAAGTAPVLAPREASGASASAASASEASFVSPTSSSVASASGGVADAQASRGVSWSWLAFFAWSAGALLVASYWSLALMSAAQLVRAAQTVTDEDWLEALARAQRSLGYAGPVRLLQSDRVSTPFAWGLGRPAVVLPASRSAWDADARVAVLEHEVAHLARHDPHVQVVAQVALALHWFNPLAWVAYRQLLLARERACDDAALAAGVTPSAYASLLLSVARLARASTAPSTRQCVALSAVSSMARPSEIERRIVFVLDPDARRGGGSKRARIVLGLGVLTALVPLAAFRPVAGVADTTTGGAEAGPAQAVASTEVGPSGPAVAGTSLSARASLRASSGPADPVPPSIPSVARPATPRPLAQQNPPVLPTPPVPPVPPSSESRPGPSQEALVLEGLDDSSPGRRDAAQVRPTPAVPEAAGSAGGVDWDAVTAARLAAESALRQRRD